MTNNTVSPTSLKPGRDYLTGQRIYAHPVIVEARIKEHAAYSIWLNDQKPTTRAAWDVLAERVDYLSTLTDEQLDGEYDDLTPKNARQFDPELADMNDQRRPQ